MNSPMFSRTTTQESALQTNKVLRNTYALLSTVSYTHLTLPTTVDV